MATPAQSTLERRLGPLDGAAIIVSNVIGGTILFAPPFMAGLVPNPWAYLGLWLAGGALAFAGAMAYAELAALRPKAGGEYVYLDAAYGRVAAFLTGWTSFVAGFCRRDCRQRVLHSDLSRALHSRRRQPDADLHHSDPVRAADVLDAHHRRHGVGVAVGDRAHPRRRPGARDDERAGGAKVTAFMLFVLAGFAFGTGAFSNVTASGGSVSTGNWLFAFIPVMLAYSGWNASAYVAEEIRDPGRNLPRSLAIGTVAVIAVYFGINLLYLFVFSITELAALKGSVLDVVADRLLGTGAGHVMGIVSIVSLMAGNSAMTFAGPRVYFAMARDGVFFEAASKVHPTYRTPAFAIIAQTIWTSLLILTGSGNALQDLHRLLDHAVPRRRGVRAVRVAVARAERPAPLQGDRLSGGAGDFHHRVLRDSRQRAVQRSGAAVDGRHQHRPVGVGLPGDRPRAAGLLRLRAKTGELNAK